MNAKIQRLKTGLDKFSKAGNMVDKLKSTTCFAKLNWRKIENLELKPKKKQEAAADEEKLKVD